MPARAQAVRGPPGQPEQLPLDPFRVVDVGGEGLLGPDALFRGVRGHPAFVAASGQGGQVRSLRDAELVLQRGQRGVRDVRHRAQAQPGQRLPGPLPHAPQRRDGQRVQEAEHAGPGYHQQPVRLAARGRDLGHELGRRDPDRAGDALLPGDLGPDMPGDRGGRPEAPQRTGYVEEGLVEGERLHLGRDRAENRHDLFRYGGVQSAAGRDEYRPRA